MRETDCIWQFQGTRVSPIRNSWIRHRPFKSNWQFPVEIGGGLLPLRKTNFGLLPGGRNLLFFIWFPTCIAVLYNPRFNKSCFIRSKSPLDAQVELLRTRCASCDLFTWFTTIIEYMQPLDERRTVFFALPAKMTSNECQKPSSLRSTRRRKEYAILHKGHNSAIPNSTCSKSAPQSIHFSSLKIMGNVFMMPPQLVVVEILCDTMTSYRQRARIALVHMTIFRFS